MAILDFFLILFFLDMKILFGGAVLGLITLPYLYLAGQSSEKSKLVFPKELIIAFIYTAGVWIGPVALAGYNLTNFAVAALISFFLLAFSELILFSLFDLEQDKADMHSSFPLKYGRKIAVRLFITSNGIPVLISLGMFLSENGCNIVFPLIIALMSVILFTLFVLKSYFFINNRYRYFGELVFFIPGLALLV